jgi:hypothetical protein
LSFATWQDLYDSELQGLYGLIAVPILFLIYRLVRGRPSGGLLPAAGAFVDAYAIIFALETIIDPIVGGPLARALGIADGPGATVILVLFVLLGDLRVYLLLFGLLAVAAGRRWTVALARAAAWTLLVPAGAYALNTALHAAASGIPSSSIWPIYEALFMIVALLLRGRVVDTRVVPLRPALHRYLRAMLLYVAVYYGAWFVADLLIQIGGLDVGWLLRVVPNQLYYALWVPVVYGAFFSRWYQSTRASTHAAR